MATPPVDSATTSAPSSPANGASRRKAPLKKVPGDSTAEHAPAASSEASLDVAALPVREGEAPWTTEEVAELRATLEEDIERFQSQIEISTAELVGLLRDGSEGAGRDPADVGSANFERDAEMSLANNAREMLDQSRLALRHIDLGTYGRCDNCGKPIGKGRLQAFPRATLCVVCKQREERR